MTTFPLLTNIQSTKVLSAMPRMPQRECSRQRGAALCSLLGWGRVGGSPASATPATSTSVNTRMLRGPLATGRQTVSTLRYCHNPLLSSTSTIYITICVKKYNKFGFYSISGTACCTRTTNNRLYYTDTSTGCTKGLFTK